MRVFKYRMETDVQAADRMARQTRERCVTGCVFKAEPKGCEALEREQ
jgi:hypothetical protein